MKFVLEISPVSIKRAIKSRRLPPSLNSRMHWSERSRWAAEFKKQVFYLAKSEKIPPVKFLRVGLINYHAGLPTDRDNLYTSFKPLGDGLVAAGIIPDDSDKYIDVRVKNVKVKTKKEQRIILVLITK